MSKRPSAARLAGSRRWHVTIPPVFRFLLRLSDGEPDDPPAYLSLIHNWECFTLGEGQQRCITAIDWDPPRELVDAGFRAIFFVEPVEPVN